MTDVVALGELLIDFATVSADNEGYPTMAAHAGGAPANFLAALNSYGAKTALLAKVGDDAFGKMLLGTIEKAGIETRGIRKDPKYFTTLAFVTFDAHGDRSFSFARKPGADTQLSPEELDLQLIDEAKVFHFGTLSLTNEPSRAATYYAVEYAKKQGKLITYDPNLRKPLWSSLEAARQQMEWGLRQADVVKISDEEVDFLFSLSPQEGAKHIVENYGASLVFVTCGAEGCFYSNGINYGHVPGLEGIKAVDTTGAGDIFGGSAMYKLLQYGKAPSELSAGELEDICAFAVRMSGLSVTKAGAIPSIPELSE